MADLVCGHKGGILKNGRIVDEGLARLIGNHAWANNRICSDCDKGVRDQVARHLDSMPTLSVPLVSTHEVEEYLGLVTGQSVIGTGVVSEFFSDFTDFFGGNSGSFEGKIATGETAALRMMKSKAIKLGADAVIGIDIDYGELGGGKGMIMVVATGTAVRWRKREETSNVPVAPTALNNTMSF